MSSGLKIGDVSKRSGVSERMIRHYEKIGLVPAPARQESGYRAYDDRELQTLLFIGRARAVGFSIEEIRQLLELWWDQSLPNKELGEQAVERAKELARKGQYLREIEGALLDLAESCEAGRRPRYPVVKSEGADGKAGS